MAQTICMTGGDGQLSYSKNSTVQKQSMEIVFFPILDKALQRVAMPKSAEPIVVADLGCSTGPNSINAVSHIVQALRSRCLESDNDKSSEVKREFQVHFSDLPWNDFNTLFRRLVEIGGDRSGFFAGGVPGDFFGRVFPRSSVRVCTSMLAMHYLSKIPKSVTDETSPAFNRGHLWLAGATDETAQAYKEQLLGDWKVLLQARSEELVSGGVLCIMIKTRQAKKANVVRPEDDEVHAVECCLVEAAEEALAKGILTEKQLNALNVPIFWPLFQEELLPLIKTFDSSFEILSAEEIKFPSYLVSCPPSENGTPDITFLPEVVTRFARAVLGGGIFGQAMENEVQDRYWECFSQIAKKYTSAFSGCGSFGCISLLKR